MSEDKQARLAEIEFYAHVCFTFGKGCPQCFLTSELKAAWAREAIMREALEFYGSSEPNPESFIVVKNASYSGENIARPALEALETVEKMK